MNRVIRITAALAVTASAGVLFAGTAVAAVAPSPSICTPHGLVVAVGNADTRLTEATAALTAAEANLASLPKDATDAQLAAAKQAVTDAQTAVNNASRQASHLDVVSVRVTANRCAGLAGV